MARTTLALALLLSASACDASESAPANADLAGAASSVGGAVDSGEEAPSCGYQHRGSVLQVASGVSVCLPPVVCTPSETCPHGLADCVDGVCVFKPGYQGLATLPEAWTRRAGNTFPRGASA